MYALLIDGPLHGKQVECDGRDRVVFADAQGRQFEYKRLPDRHLEQWVAFAIGDVDNTVVSEAVKLGRAQTGVFTGGEGYVQVHVA